MHVTEIDDAPEPSANPIAAGKFAAGQTLQAVALGALSSPRKSRPRLLPQFVELSMRPSALKAASGQPGKPICVCYGVFDSLHSQNVSFAAV